MLFSFIGIILLATFIGIIGCPCGPADAYRYRYAPLGALPWIPLGPALSSYDRTPCARGCRRSVLIDAHKRTVARTPRLGGKGSCVSHATCRNYDCCIAQLAHHRPQLDRSDEAREAQDDPRVHELHQDAARLSARSHAAHRQSMGHASHIHARDWARPCPHLHRDCARPCPHLRQDRASCASRAVRILHAVSVALCTPLPEPRRSCACGAVWYRVLLRATAWCGTVPCGRRTGWRVQEYPYSRVLQGTRGYSTAVASAACSARRGTPRCKGTRRHTK
jgi:hypothetical protein